MKYCCIPDKATTDKSRYTNSKRLMLNCIHVLPSSVLSVNQSCIYITCFNISYTTTY